MIIVSNKNGTIVYFKFLWLQNVKFKLIKILNFKIIVIVKIINLVVVYKVIKKLILS